MNTIKDLLLIILLELFLIMLLRNLLKDRKIYVSSESSYMIMMHLKHGIRTERGMHGERKLFYLLNYINIGLLLELLIGVILQKEQITG
jgi:hypothetical protein